MTARTDGGLDAMHKNPRPDCVCVAKSQAPNRDELPEFVIFIGAGARISAGLLSLMKRRLAPLATDVELVAGETDIVALVRGYYPDVSERVLELLTESIPDDHGARPPLFVWPYELEPRTYAFSGGPKKKAKRARSGGIQAFIEVNLRPTTPGEPSAISRIETVYSILSACEGNVTHLRKVRNRDRLFLKLSARDMSEFDSLLGKILQLKGVHNTETFPILHPRPGRGLSEVDVPTRRRAGQDVVYFLQTGSAGANPFLHDLDQRKTALFGTSEVEIDPVYGDKDTMILVHPRSRESDRSRFDIANMDLGNGQTPHSVEPFLLSPVLGPRSLKLDEQSSVRAYVEVHLRVQDRSEVELTAKRLVQALESNLEYAAAFVNRPRILLRLRAPTAKALANLIMDRLHGAAASIISGSRTHIVVDVPERASRYGGNVAFILRILQEAGASGLTRSEMRDQSEKAGLNWHAMSTGALRKLIDGGDVKVRGRGQETRYSTRSRVRDE